MASTASPGRERLPGEVTAPTSSRPFNQALQFEANSYLRHERVAEASAGSTKSDVRALMSLPGQPPLPRELLFELENGECVGYPARAPSPSTAVTTSRSPLQPLPIEKLNPAQCTTAEFDDWLLAVVQSIPATAEASYTAAQQPQQGGVDGAKKNFAARREEALYAALELLETAARLLQRRTVLCGDQDRVLRAYYHAVEEDIRDYATRPNSDDGDEAIQSLLPPEQHRFSPFHYQLRTYKRAEPLRHYSAEQHKLQQRLDKLYYVLMKLEEVEGVSNSILVEGRAPPRIHALPQPYGPPAVESERVVSTAASSPKMGGSRNDGDGGDGGGSIAARDALSQMDGEENSAALAGERTGLMSRRMVGMERRVRRLRHQLRLPLPASEVRSRLRNDLILSFSARVLALREPAPFTSEVYTTAAASGVVSASSLPYDQFAPYSTPLLQSSQSISAFVEWYVQQIMDPLAISQLLSIVPREYVVTTTCRLVCACEAHAALRSSRALPDLGQVLLRAVAEGRADAVAQLLLSTSVSYRSALTNPMDCHTCFYAGLLCGQLDVLERLVEQQNWHADALHVMLFTGAPWNPTPTASRGCYVYQHSLLQRVQAFLAVAGRITELRKVADARVFSTSLEDKNFARTRSMSEESYCDTDGAAAEALNAYHLLDESGEAVKMLAALSHLLSGAVTAFAAQESIDALERQRVSRRFAEASDHVTAAEAAAFAGDDEQPESHQDSGVVEETSNSSHSMSIDASHFQVLSSLARPPVSQLPVFLGGALHRLRLFLDVRSAMLQFERLQKDSQWAALLGSANEVMGASGAASSATRANFRVAGLDKRRDSLHTPPGTVATTRTVTAEGVSSDKSHPQDGHVGSNSALRFPGELTLKPSFSHVLHQQRHLDAFSAAAMCPLRCRMCPAFSTPLLQRVDAWSYGPLQATATAPTLSAHIDRAGDGSVKPHISSDLIPLSEHLKQLIGFEEGQYRNTPRLDSGSRSISSWPSRHQPVKALLMRADTAITVACTSWYVHNDFIQPTCESKYRQGGSGSGVSDDLSGQPYRRVQGFRGAPPRGLRQCHTTSPWQLRSITGSLLSKIPFRYSYTTPLEDVRRAAQDARQRRAWRSLYGRSVSGTDRNDFDPEDSDEDTGSGSWHLGGQQEDKDAGLADAVDGGAPALPSTPSFYFEAQLSVPFLLALHSADRAGRSLLDEAAAGNALSEAAVHRLCENCIVVGLCDGSFATRANGCTQSPSQPHPTTHLGHASRGTDGDSSEGNVVVTKDDGVTSVSMARTSEVSSSWSAGVSVAVVAREIITSASQAPLAAEEPAGTALKKADVDGSAAEVVYLALWRHQQNTVHPVSTVSDVQWERQNEAADASRHSTTPVFLRIELPRVSAALPRESMGVTDVSCTALPSAYTRSLSSHAPPPQHCIPGDEECFDEPDAVAEPPRDGLWLPTVMPASREDIAAVIARQTEQQQQQEEGRYTATPHLGEELPLETSKQSPVRGTLVLGLLFNPVASSLRLRLNNYTAFEEIPLTCPACVSVASEEDAAAQVSPASLTNLYPAATLSLNEHGWRSWYTHQTCEWTRQQQPHHQAGVATMATDPEAARDNQRSPSQLSVSNAVLRFCFDASTLQFAAPPRVVLTPVVTMASSTNPVASRQQPRLPLSKPTFPPSTTCVEGSAHPQKTVFASMQRAGGPVALLDSSAKFMQVLSTLTDVALLAATKTCSDKHEQQQQLSNLVLNDAASDSEDSDGERKRGVTSSPGGASQRRRQMSWVGSRDRRARAALLQVENMLNNPGGGAGASATGSGGVGTGVAAADNLADIFYPPIRIYRHSCNSPSQELYPLSGAATYPPDAPATACETGGKRQTSHGTSQHRQAQQSRGNRRIRLGDGGGASPQHFGVNGGAGPAGGNSNARGPAGGVGASTSPFANVYWYDIIPENARLTPLCAALASRQRAMAYAIAIHPLTRFCDFGSGDGGNDKDARQLQSQHRRTALLAACALGYAEVVQVLLERIPVEELLSYFGIVTESEARAALQRCYGKANSVFLRQHRLRALAEQAETSSAGNADGGSTGGQQGEVKTSTLQGSRDGKSVPYLTNEKQRAMIDTTAMYSSSRSIFTPLHVALLGVVMENGEPDEEDEEYLSCSGGVDAEWDDPDIFALRERLRKRTACATLLLNCLYDLLCVAPVTKDKPAVKRPYSPKLPGKRGEAEQRPASPARYELLTSALNVQSRTGETALLIAVRQNNVVVARRLLKLGAQPACMDRVTRLLCLELACANRCTPIAEALLQNRVSVAMKAVSSGGSVALSAVTAPASTASIYATSPVLLNHAGIATALCWCAINNMPAVLQRLLECDGIDVECGFEGSSPLHLAIAFNSEEAALALLNGTQPRKSSASNTRKIQSCDYIASDAAGGAAAATRQSGFSKHPASAAGSGSRGRQTAPSSAAGTLGTRDVHSRAHRKPFLDVNKLHERTHTTPLHLACERGQLTIIRVLLQSWHAQLNIAAAYSNYTPLLAALANGQQEAALRILEYSKDELRRGRAVLDLCAIDQHGDTALHLAAKRGLHLALEYMLIQFSEEEVARLAAIHPTLRSSPASMAASWVVPVHVVNKQGKSALLAAIQSNQAETTELLVSTLIDSVNAQEAEGSSAVLLGSNAAASHASLGAADGSHPSMTPTDMVASHHSLFGGPLIEGTCMALSQAHKKHMDSTVQLMLSAPPSLFPCTNAFRESVQAYTLQQQHRLQGRRSRLSSHNEQREAGNTSRRQTRNVSLGTSASNAAGGGSDTSLRKSVIAQDRVSFVRLLLTRAAWPTISPSEALRFFLRGFTLPELYTYLNEVAMESAALGVQRASAMAHSELLIGYLQEHAGSVVAPTRAVLFCREVLRCLEQWLCGEAVAARMRAEAKFRQHRAGGVSPSNSSIALLQMIRSEDYGGRGETTEAPIAWLYGILFASNLERSEDTSKAGALPCSAVAASIPCCSAPSAEVIGIRNTAVDYCSALESTLDRKTLSLDVARMIRLHGRSHCGARAIEEIKAVAQAYVKGKVNERNRQMGRMVRQPSSPEAARSPTLKTRGAQEAENSATLLPVLNNSFNTSSANNLQSGTSERSDADLVGNEALFTTPMGFTVLQLATALRLTEVVAFLVETYNLDPLYAPAQAMYTYKGLSSQLGEDDTSPLSTELSSPMRARQQGDNDNSGNVTRNKNNSAALRKEEAARVRDVVAHTVRGLAQARESLTACADLASHPDGAHGPQAVRVEDALWFCWTPYRLAVRSGNTRTVEELLKVGEAVSSSPIAAADTELCSDSSGATGVFFTAHQSEGTASPRVSSPSFTAARPPAAIVDYKEPSWLDSFERTALQERVVVATTSQVGGSSTHNEFLASVKSATSTMSSGATALDAVPTLSETLAMVYLLLKHGAQPNGLFDRTGSDAWLLALADGSASELPITQYGDENTKRSSSVTGESVETLESSLFEAQSSVTTTLDPSSTSPSPLTSVRSGTGGVAGQRCVDLLLRFRAPLLGEALTTARRFIVSTTSEPHLPGARSKAGQAELNDQLLHHAPRLLHQWQRLPCMRCTFASGTREASGEVWRPGPMRTADLNPNADGGSSAKGTTLSVFEEAEVLWKCYEEEQKSLFVGTSLGSPLDVRTTLLLPTRVVLSPKATATTTLPSTEKRERAMCGTSKGGVCLDVKSLGGEDERSKEVCTESPFAEAHIVVDLLKSKLIVALRVCYRVVLLYMCVENTPRQLLRLLRTFGPVALPISARHPLSGDSVIMRLLRKACARLVTPATSSAGDATRRSIATFISPTTLSNKSSIASACMQNLSNGGMDAVSVSALHEPLCAKDPSEDTEARAAVDTCAALIHFLRDAHSALTNPFSPYPDLEATKATAIAAGHTLRLSLFQPSCDGETALSLAARIAYVPLISILVQAGAAVVAPLVSSSTFSSQVQPSGISNGRDVVYDPMQDARSLIGYGVDRDEAAVCDLSGLRVTSNCSLHSNLSDEVVRMLLATRVYYAAHEMGTVRILLDHMPSEDARRTFLRWVYPNIHPLPALQLAMDYVDSASDFLTGADCMNALWTNLLYAHFTGQLDTAVRATAQGWNALLRVVLPGAPAVPIYLVMRAAPHEEPTEDVERAGFGSHSNSSRPKSTAAASVVPPGSFSASFQSSVTSKKQAKARLAPVALSNWSHLVRRTSLFLQLMSMSVAETLMGKTVQPVPPSAVSGVATNTSATGSPTPHGSPMPPTAAAGGESRLKKGALQTLHQPRVHETATVTPPNNTAAVTKTRGLSGTLLWDTIELAVRYDDKNVLRYLLQLRLPDIVQKHISNIQQLQQSQTLSLNSPQTLSARGMEVAAAAILGSYPSFAGVSTASQAAVVLERLQRVLWREALQERHVDLLAVAAASISTLRHLYTSAPLEVRSQMDPMRYDRVDVHSGMPEGMEVEVDATVGEGEEFMDNSPRLLPSGARKSLELPHARGSVDLKVGDDDDGERRAGKAQRNAQRGTVLPEQCRGATHTLRSFTEIPDIRAAPMVSRSVSESLEGPEARITGHLSEKSLAARSPSKYSSPILAEVSSAQHPSVVEASAITCAAKQELSAAVLSDAWIPGGQNALSPTTPLPHKRRKDGKGNTEEDPVVNAADAELRFIESCVQNDRSRLKAREEQRRRVTAVSWGLGGATFILGVPSARTTSRASNTDADSFSASVIHSRPTLPGGSQLLVNSNLNASQHSTPTGTLDAVATKKDGGEKAAVWPPLPSPLPSAFYPVVGSHRKVDDRVGEPDTSAVVQKTEALVCGSSVAKAREERKDNDCPQSAIKMKVNVPNLTPQPHRNRPRGRSSVLFAFEGVELPVVPKAGTLIAVSPRAVEPVYFMYLQMDWALHSTRLLRSPRPSSATLDTIMFLLEQRCALSVSVLDLFLAGTVAPSAPREKPRAQSGAPSRSSTCSSSSSNDVGTTDSSRELHLSLRYQSRHHQDTLLHLLVIHDQCQLAEYYLEYCYFWFVSNGLDPEPVCGRPGRFPLDDMNSATEDPRGASDSDEEDDVCCWGADGRTRRGQRQRRQSDPQSRMIDVVPRSFLRCMLRVNAHGLTAFEYAHTPAMLQLLQWYGCVPPTYRPNPRVFQRVVYFSPGNAQDGQSGEIGESYAFAHDSRSSDEDEDIDDEDGVSSGGGAQRKGQAAPHRSRGAASSVPRRRKREVLRFFPVPRLVLASDSFVSLLDTTGEELASTANRSVTALARSAITDRAVEQLLKDDRVPKHGALSPTRTQKQQQQMQDRRIAALVNHERRQLIVSRRRRQQQERAKALLFEQVAAQTRISADQITDRGDAGGKQKPSTGTALAYLARATAAQRRKEWEAQRHPVISEAVLWHNAFEAQRLSSSALSGSKSTKKKSGTAGSKGVPGVLPILLSEEVSLLHLGLCSFEDELVRLYGELHTAPGLSSDATSAGLDHNEERHGTSDVARLGSDDEAGLVLSAYSRLLLPPSVLKRPTLQQLAKPKSENSDGARRQGSRSAGGEGTGEGEQTKGLANSKAGGNGLALPHIISAGTGSAAVPPLAAHSREVSRASAASIAGGASHVAGSTAHAPVQPPRLSQMDIVFLLECQQFVVYPLTLPATEDVTDTIEENNDDALVEEDRRHSSSRRGGGTSARASNVGLAKSAGDRNTGVVSRTSFQRSAGVLLDRVGGAVGGNLAEVITRCTGGDVSRRAGATAEEKRRAKMLATRATQISLLGPRCGRREPFRADGEGGGASNIPPSDLPLLRSLFARKAADDTSAELVDKAERRYDAALLVSLTPMLLSGIVDSSLGGARATPAAVMRNLAERLSVTQWKQFSSRPVAFGRSADAATTATEVVPLLNVPPFVLGDVSSPHSTSRTLPLSTVDHHASLTAPLSAGAASGRSPIALAARLDEWVSRRRLLHSRASQSLKSAVISRSGRPSERPGSRLPPSSLITPRGMEDGNVVPERPMQDAAHEAQDEDGSAFTFTQVTPVGGIATAAQQSLMRVLLKRFTAATGAQLSEQMGLLVTPNYDVEEVGDTAAVLREMEAKTTLPSLKVQGGHR